MLSISEIITREHEADMLSALDDVIMEADFIASLAREAKTGNATQKIQQVLNEIIAMEYRAVNARFHAEEKERP